ncbi:MAG: hypothetical protein ACOYKM_09280 [Caulobacterales bacterium]
MGNFAEWMGVTMHLKVKSRAIVAALALGLAACSGSSVSSPGATSAGTGSGGGTGGGGTGGGGTTVSCPTGTTSVGSLAGSTICGISGQILSDLTLRRVAGVVYQLTGRVDVGADVGGAGNNTNGRSVTLTVEPGVTVFGASGLDYLVINRGSRIFAEGTVSQPIIFTSRNDIAGTGNRDTAQAEWGGLVLLGRAPINECRASGVAGGAVDCENEIEGVAGASALFGGNTPTDSSGTLRYVQVRYPGFELSAGRELNGITFGGVGSGTTVEYVQVHNSSDDGVEFFGGTVNARYLAITGADDDSVDVEMGYQGRIQFLAIRQRAGGGDKLFENDNYSGTLTTLTADLVNKTPRSNPTIANFTAVGVNPNGSGASAAIGGLHQREGMAGSFVNGIAAGSGACLDIDNQSLSTALPSYNGILLGCATAFNTDADDEAVTFNAGSNNVVATPSQLTLTGLLPGPFERARTPAPTPSGLTPAAYLGAFSPTETVASNWTTGWTFAGSVFPIAGCPAGTTEDGTLAGQRRCVLPSVIVANTRLSFGNIYEVNGRVDVGRDIGAAATNTNGLSVDLTIDPGVTLFGRNGLDYLVINRGSRIFANGSPTAPVIMTSFADLTNPAGRNEATAQGEWGGLVLLGRAPINECRASGAVGGTVDCESEVEGVAGTPALFGGALANDNSGSLTYLQVRYAGFELTAGRELNGITFGGVGSGTTLEYVQVHNSSDDGVEFFGGTINGRYLIMTGADDDSFDVEMGYTGNLQFLLAVQRAGGGDKLVESDNYSGTLTTLTSVLVNKTPRSNPTVANFTFVGVNPNGSGASAAVGGLHQREGMAGTFVNGVVTGSGQCLDIDNQSLTTALPTYRSILLGCATAFNTDADDEATVFNAGTNNVANAALTLQSVFVNGTFETAATSSTPSGSFFTPAPYVGAVRNASDTWWQSWTCGLVSGASC